MGFYDARAKNVIFVNVVCFEEENENDPNKSALCVTFHEFFHAILDRIPSMYDLLLHNINREDFIRFVSRPLFLDNFLKIYGKSKINPQYELVIQYITNNPDTKCLLDAIFNGDENFQSPELFRNLSIQLIELLEILKDKAVVTLHG